MTTHGVEIDLHEAKARYLEENVLVYELGGEEILKRRLLLSSYSLEWPSTVTGNRPYTDSFGYMVQELSNGILIEGSSQNRVNLLLAAESVLPSRPVRDTRELSFATSDRDIYVLHAEVGDYFRMLREARKLNIMSVKINSAEDDTAVANVWMSKVQIDGTLRTGFSAPRKLRPLRNLIPFIQNTSPVFGHADSDTVVNLLNEALRLPA